MTMMITICIIVCLIFIAIFFMALLHNSNTRDEKDFDKIINGYIKKK